MFLISAAKEIDELEEAVINLGEEVEEGIDTVGVGDLLDDFVVLAAQVIYLHPHPMISPSTL